MSRGWKVGGEGLEGERLGARENIHMKNVWRLKTVSFGMRGGNRLGDHQQMDDD